MMYLPKHLREHAPRLPLAGSITCCLCNSNHNETMIRLTKNPKRYAHKSCLTKDDLMKGRRGHGE